VDSATQHEPTRIDKMLAVAHEIGSRPNTAAFTTEYIGSGTVCSWCDRPAEAHENGEICAGCPYEAIAAHHILCGRPEWQKIPVCRGHFVVALRFLVTVAEGLGLDARVITSPDDFRSV